MKTTHTYAILEVSAGAFKEIQTRLEAAGYSHAFHEDDNRTVIDMHGIALAREALGASVQTDTTKFEVASILSARTKRGMISVALNNESTQMDLDKAREIVGMLQGAIEAAVSDELLWHFCVEKADMDEVEAGAALLEFREIRQGSKGTVYPQ